MELPWSEERTLGRLLRRARSGDREAFRALYRALYPRIWAWLARRARSREECEDLTAGTFEKLLAQLERWDEARGGVIAFALGIARNLRLDGLRAELRARRPEAAPDEGALLELATPQALLEKAEELRALRTQLARLEPEVRELLALRFVDGLGHREIAALLGASEAAIKQRCSRALRGLREELRESGLEEEPAP